MTDRLLSAQQLTVISALSSGATLTAAAEEAGVHRNTINNWRRNVAVFRNALADAQYDRALYYREKIEELFAVALETLQDILTDAKASASTKLKAALTILQTATIPPAPRQSTPEQIAPVAQSAHNPAQTEPGTSSVKSTQHAT
jgi:transposase-like protein